MKWSDFPATLLIKTLSVVLTHIVSDAIILNIILIVEVALFKSSLADVPETKEAG